MYNTTQVRYLIRETLVGLSRRFVSGTVAVLIMGSALLMLALFSLIAINLDRVLQGVRGEIDVTAYLETDLDEAARLALMDEFRGTSGILDVRYISPERALEEFRNDLGADAELVDALEANPLPPSFRLTVAQNLQNPRSMRELANSLGAYDGVEEIEANVEWIRRLDRVTNLFRWVSVIVGVLVVVSAIFVISNTVKLTIQERARSVEIMRLVGATDWFIRSPFVMGGAFQGAMAGLVAMMVLKVAYRFLEANVEGVFFFGNGQIFGFVLLSTLLGAGGSSAALHRYLKL